MTITKSNINEAIAGDALVDTNSNYYEIIYIDSNDPNKIIIYASLYNKPVLIIAKNGIFCDKDLNPIPELNHPFANFHFHPAKERRG